MRTNERYSSAPSNVPVRSTRAAGALVLAAAALWGTSGTAQALSGVHDPVAVAAARVTIGGAVLLIVALLRYGHRAVLACLRRPLLGWTCAAAAATALYQVAFFSAVAATGVATGTVITLGVAPVATGLCAVAAFGERLTGWWAGATGLAIAGCTVLVTASAGGGAVRPGGVGLAVAAGACYGVYTTAAKALLDRGVPVVVAMAATLSIGATPLTIVLATHGVGPASITTIAMIAWLGLGTAAAAYLFFAAGLRRLPAGTVGTLSLAEPLTAAGFGLFVLGERPGPGAVAGGLVLLTGLVLITIRPVRAAEDAVGAGLGVRGLPCRSPAGRPTHPAA